MNIDIPIIFLNGIVSFVLGFGLYLNTNDVSILELRKIAVLNIIQGTGFFISALSSAFIDSMVFYLIGNSIVIISQTFLFRYIIKLNSLEVKYYYPQILTIVFLFIQFYFFFIEKNLKNMVGSFGIAISFFSIANAFTFFKSNIQTEGKLKYFISSVLVTFGFLLLVRELLDLIYPNRFSFLFNENTVVDTYGLALFYIAVFSFGILSQCYNQCQLTKKKLDVRNQKLSMVFEQSPVSIVITNAKGDIEYVNPRFSEITGYRPEEVIGKNPRVLKTGHTSHEEYVEMWNLLSSGHKWKGIFRNKTKNGEFYWESASISPIVNTEGIITNYIGIKENITARLLAENLLKESEEKYRQILKTSHDYIHILDKNGNLIEFNFAFLTHLEYTEEEAKNLNVSDWDVQWSKEELSEIVPALMHEPRIFETIHKTKTGKLIDVEISATGLQIKGEYYLYASARDITERKKHEMALKESEQKFKSFFQMNKANFLLIDPEDGRILDVNPASVEFYGYTLYEFSKMKIREINTLSSEEIRKEMQAAVERKRNYFNFKHKLKNGNIRDVEVYSTPVVVSDKKVLFSIVHDVTDRKTAEALLKKSEADLRESNIAKDKFFSIIAHDLKGPIGTVSNFLELVTDKEFHISDAEKEKIFELSKISTKNLVALLENLLTWSRSQRGDIEYKPQIYRLYDLVRDNINLFMATADNKHISLINEVGKDIYTYLDYEMINTVIRNLISNAIKYTNEKGKIKVTAVDKDDFTEIHVIDNGIGMSEKIRESLFHIELKQPSMHGTRGEKGSRIGLILCKEFINRHGGKIEVKSELNKGSEFIITLYNPRE